MIKNNFSCENCKSELYISRFSSKNEECNVRYFVFRNLKQELVCEVCKKPLTYISQFEGFGTNYGKFASSTPDERAKILEKRSHEHYLKEIHEKKIEMNKNIKFKGIS